MGQPAEVATAFVFLASTESSYTSGEVLAVTGGQPITVSALPRTVESH